MIDKILESKWIPWQSGSLRARLASGTFWSLMGAFVGQGMGLVVSVVAARLLGKMVFGELGIINSTVGMLGIFAGLGLGTTTTKYVAEYCLKDPDRAGRVIGVSTVAAVAIGGLMSIALFLLTPWLTAAVLNAPHLTGEIRATCLFLFLNSLIGVQTGTLIGFEAFRAIAMINVMRGVSSFVFTALGVLFFGLWGAVWAMVLAAALNLLINQIFLRKQYRRTGVTPEYRTAGREQYVLWKFSLPALLSSAMFVPVTWLANVMLVNQANGYAEMGVFNAANQWRMAITFVPGVIGQTVLPILASLYGERAIRSYEKVLWANLAVVGVLGIGIAIPIIIVSRQIMTFYGDGFAQGQWVLILTAITGVLFSCTGVIGSALSSIGKMWQGFGLNCIWGVVFVVTARLYVHEGAFGLAIAYLLSYAVHFISVGLYSSLALRIALPGRRNQAPS